MARNPVMMLESFADQILLSSTASPVASPPLARSPVVSTRVTATTTPRLVAATPGSARTPRATGVTVKCDSALSQWFRLENVGYGLWSFIQTLLSQTVLSTLGSTLMQTSRLCC